MTLAKEKKDIFNDSSRPLTANEIFAGDDEFYQLLSKDIDASAVSSQHPQPSSTSKKSPAATTSASPQRLSRSTIAIRVGIGLIAAMLLVPISLYCVSSIVTPSPRSPAQTDATHAAVVTENVSESASPPAPPLEEPVSWKLAQSYYKKKDYAKASSIYSRLSESLLLSNPTQSLWNDYLNLKLALCAYKLKETALSKNYLAKAIQSSSPATVALSNYYLAFIKNEQRHYSDARLRAYKALAMLETIDQQYSEDLIADCYFLIAQTLTADALLGRNQKLESPANWPQIPFHEPLEQLGEAELLHIFQSSMESLNSVAMGPKIKKLDTGSPRYLAKCSGASVEELFTAFASESGQDIRWLCSFANVRNRPITLYLSSTTPQKFFDTASGSVGLLASFEDNQTLINDPVNILSIAEHQKLLTTEAISAWQRFMLSYRNDIRVADAHFAIGFLQQSNDQLPIATSEFRLVANRFMRSELAAYSLLNAAKIKLDMQDTVGARDYLKELYVQYPDSPIFDKAILLLAQTSMAIGDHAYAGQVFRKICTLTISEDYKLAAMLGAAKCYFSMNDFASAADWFIQYAIAAKKNTDNTADLREAYTMLAEANIKLGKFDEACRSYRSAMTLTSNTDETFDVAIKLINLCRNQCRFVEAFDTIEEIDTSLLSDVQVARIWLIKTQILSAMNLNEQAVSFLNSRINTVRDSRLRTEMSLQLGRSHIALNDLQTARDTLCQAILHSEPGFLTTQLQYELAIVCVKLGDNAQAVKICSQILASSIPDELRTQTRTLLATAYTNQKQYDKAAKIFSGAIDAAGARQL